MNVVNAFGVAYAGTDSASMGWEGMETWKNKDFGDKSYGFDNAGGIVRTDPNVKRAVTAGIGVTAAIGVWAGTHLTNPAGWVAAVIELAVLIHAYFWGMIAN
jgi:hypothetical protein